jgi:hypothetical protein
MRYTGSYADEHWQLGTAWATDPYGPWQRPAAPDIVLGPAGAWDDNRLVRGAIHYHEGRYYSPYTGFRSGTGYQGGIASADPVALDDDLVFATRTSPDGVAWQEWRPVANGGQIQSSPGAYLQYSVAFAASTEGLSPVLTRVAIEYQETTSVAVPLAFGLSANYPNPFNPATTIRFTLPDAQPVRLAIYGLDGRRVALLADAPHDAGTHELAWDGRNDAGQPVASGTYFCRLEAGPHRQVRKMALIK